MSSLLPNASYGVDMSSFIRESHTDSSWISTLLQAGLLGTCCVITAAVITKALPTVDDLRARLQRILGAPQNVDRRFIRQVARDVEIATVDPTRNHTHGLCAALRTSAIAYSEDLALLLGCVPFMVQMSNSNVAAGFRGSRSPYWSKDLDVAPSQVRPEMSDIPVYIDVDWYLNMEHILAVARHKAHIIYTITPEAAASTDAVSGEVDFLFRKSGEIQWGASGNKPYVHKLWDYSQDTLVVSSWDSWFQPCVSTYLTDLKRSSEHRSIVVLTQMQHWTGLRALIAMAAFKLGFIDGNRLNRFDPIVKLSGPRGDIQHFVRFDVRGVNDLTRHTGIADTYIASSLPASVDDNIGSIARTTSKLSPFQIREFVTDTERKHGAVQAALEFHRAHNGYGCTARLAIGLNNVGAFDYDLMTELDKPTMRPFMHPILPGACYPNQSVANEERAVERRVVDVKAPVINLSNKLRGYIGEFVELFLPEQGKLFPVEWETIWENQPRNTQRLILTNALNLLPDSPTLKGFMKAESYGKPNDPRIIVSDQPVHKLEYAMVISSLSDYVKYYSDCGEGGVWGGRTRSWYAFGTTPREVAHMVADVCNGADSVLGTDASRWDGRKSNILRYIEQRLLARAFPPWMVPEILELHKQSYFRRTIMRNGTKFATDYGQSSGMADTSFFNTVDDAFICYLGLRLSGLGPVEAWRGLGIYGGDDGLTANLPFECVQKAANMVGQVFTRESWKRGDTGVEFLSRQFGPWVWYGDPTSTCDLKRQLMKFHLTSGPQVAAEVRLIEKAQAFALTDGNTPIIGKFCHKVLELAGAEVKPSLATWYARYDTADQFPNDFNDWMWNVAEQSLDFCHFDSDGFNTWLDSISTLDELMAMPEFFDNMPTVPVSSDVVVGDDIVRAEPVEIEENTECEKPVKPDLKAPPKSPSAKRAKTSGKRINRRQRRAAEHRGKSPK